MAQILDTPDAIEAYRLLALYHRCRLEAKGLRFKINTCAVVRREFGITARKREDVVDQFGQILKDKGVLRG